MGHPVSNLGIQYIDKDEASEDLSVVERELNDDYLSWRKYFWKLSRLSEIIQVDVLESRPLSLHTKVETCRSC